MINSWRVHFSPQFKYLFVVLYLLSKIKRQFGDVFSSFSIILVMPSRMIQIKFRLKLSHQVVTEIKLRYVFWIPSNWKGKIFFVKLKFFFRQKSQTYISNQCFCLKPTEHRSKNCSYGEFWENELKLNAWYQLSIKRPIFWLLKVNFLQKSEFL